MAAIPVPATIGRYRVLGVLGKGAMGIVYHAIDPVIDRAVAIKAIRTTLDADELAAYEARFAQEVKTVGKLNHANIVTIYDVGRTDQFAYMAMEYVEGHELKAYMLGDGRVPMGTAADLVAQVAEGLAFAHSRGVVHRDVKPANIMVTMEDGRALAKVMDFGIARDHGASLKTVTGMILGSPRYMAPEQVAGRKAGGEADQFSLAVVLYELVAGVPPFEAEAVSAVMYQTVHVKETPPSERNADVPAALDALIARALAKAPEDRFPSMKDFARELREVARALPAPGPLPEPKVSPLATQTLPSDITMVHRSRPGSPAAATAPPQAQPEPSPAPLTAAKPQPVPEPEPALRADFATLAPVAAPFPVGAAALLGSLALVAAALGIALLR